MTSLVKSTYCHCSYIQIFGIYDLRDMNDFFTSLCLFLNFPFAALLCKISALRSFSLDKLHYRRENDSGTSSLAYFMAKDTVDHFNTLIKPLVFLSMFFFFNNPRSTFTDNYVVLLCLVYCVTGIAYVFAIFFPPSQAQLVHCKFIFIIKWYFNII